MAGTNFKDKAASLSLGPKPAVGATPRAVDTQRPRSAIGVHLQAIHQDKELAKHAEDLEQQLKEFEGANPTKLLDPALVHNSKWADRIEDSFKLDEFQLLKDEIADAGGNIQPIKVRSMPAQPGEYEIVYGHRRCRACQELGLPVLAIIEALDDQALFEQMDRENRHRANLRPYEQGRMYARALDEGLFPSLRKLAEGLGGDVGNISRAVALARLPADVLNAFPSPLELQFRWAVDLTDALQRDPERVLTLARVIASRNPRPNSKAVLEELCAPAASQGGKTTPAKMKISGTNGSSAVIRFKDNKAEIALDGVPESKRGALAEVIEKFLK